MLDIKEVLDYYAEIDLQLGDNFLTQLGAALATIKRNPLFASIRYDEIRCAQLKKFPYLIHYHVDEQKMIVRVLSIYATYREPRY